MKIKCMPGIIVVFSTVFGILKVQKIGVSLL